MNQKLSKRIAELGRLMAEAPDLADVDAHFHDQVVSHPEFMAAGVPRLHKPLIDIVGKVAGAYGHPLQTRTLYYVPECSLWHGWLGNIAESMALIVYFDDQHVGMACICSWSDPLAHRIRFSLPEGLARDPNAVLEPMSIASFTRRTTRGVA